MKSSLRVLALMFLFASVMVLPVKAVVIPHTNNFQPPRSTNWCWACCDYVIMNHYVSNPPSMEAIVHWIHFGHSLQCNPDNNCPYDAPLYRAAATCEARDALNNWGIPTSLQSNGLTRTGLRSQIINGSMVWCRFGPKSGMGHAELAVGWNDGILGEKVIYFEPNDGDDHTTSWSNYSSGGFLNPNWNWTHSIFDFSRRRGE